MTTRKKNAVVKLESDGSIRVVNVHYLIGFQPIWRTDPNSWPRQTTLEDDEDEDANGAVVQILHIDDMQGCQDYFDRLQAANASQSNAITTQVESLNQTVNRLAMMVKDLQLKMDCQQRKITELNDALAFRGGEKVIYQVGIHKTSVEAQSLTESSIRGLLDIKGFTHLLKKIIDVNLFDSNYTWQNLDRLTQEKIGDLLAFYVIHGHARKYPGQDLNYESATNAFYTIYRQLVHKFQNDKCKFSKRQPHGTPPNSNSSCDSTSIEWNNHHQQNGDIMDTSSSSANPNSISFKRARTPATTITRKMSKSMREQIDTHFDNLGELKDPSNVKSDGIPDFGRTEVSMLEALANEGTIPSKVEY